jgi:hypothetical protein
MLEESGEESLDARLDFRGILTGVVGEQAGRRASLLPMPSATTCPT